VNYDNLYFHFAKYQEITSQRYSICS